MAIEVQVVEITQDGENRKCWRPPASMCNGTVVLRIILEPIVVTVTVATIVYYLTGMPLYFAVALLAIYVQGCFTIWLGATRRDFKRVRSWLVNKTMETCSLLILAIIHKSYLEFTLADWCRIVVFSFWRLYTFFVVGFYAAEVRSEEKNKLNRQVNDRELIEQLQDKIMTCVFQSVTYGIIICAFLVGLIPYITKEKNFDGGGTFLTGAVIVLSIILGLHGYALFCMLKQKRIWTAEVKKLEEEKLLRAWKVIEMAQERKREQVATQNNADISRV